MDSNKEECNICGESCSFIFDKMFSVTQELWEKYGNGKGYMCIDCLESRIGAKLTPLDFEFYLCNRNNKRVIDIFNNHKCEYNMFFNHKKIEQTIIFK